MKTSGPCACPYPCHGWAAVARTHRLYSLWLLLVSTGLRRGEVLALTWSDIDMANGRLCNGAEAPAGPW